MIPDPNQTVGPPSEKTERNIRRARAHRFRVKSTVVEWKARTGQWFWVPVTFSQHTELWNEGPVWWSRFYWLSFGLSMITPMDERRRYRDSTDIVHEHSFIERRLYPYGISQIFPRRASED